MHMDEIMQAIDYFDVCIQWIRVIHEYSLPEWILS